MIICIIISFILNWVTPLSVITYILLVSSITGTVSRQVTVHVFNERSISLDQFWIRNFGGFFGLYFKNKSRGYKAGLLLYKESALCALESDCTLEASNEFTFFSTHWLKHHWMVQCKIVVSIWQLHSKIYSIITYFCWMVWQ